MSIPATLRVLIARVEQADPALSPFRPPETRWMSNEVGTPTGKPRNHTFNDKLWRTHINFNYCYFKTTLIMHIPDHYIQSNPLEIEVLIPENEARQMLMSGQFVLRLAS